VWMRCVTHVGELDSGSTTAHSLSGCMCYDAPVDEACHACGWVRQRHVARRSAVCVDVYLVWGRGMLHMWMRHVTHDETSAIAPCSQAAHSLSVRVLIKRTPPPQEKYHFGCVSIGRDRR